MEYLSNIELYYSPQENFSDKGIILNGEDFRHAVKVMRHVTGEIIYVTEGEGRIFKCEITGIEKEHILLRIIEVFGYNNLFRNVYFCIPKLKNGDRFEFALEKSVELGVTNFIIYDAERALAKGNKTDRWQKIALSAMKQSLRSFLPKIIQGGPIKEIAERVGNKYVFDQNGMNKFNFAVKDYGIDSYFIFGPEGGLSEKELNYFKDNDIYNLYENRLRSETAVIVCASML